jgi:SagB-type dehydrogenase family enzyme
VEGVEPGCYHYNGKQHSLDLLHSIDKASIGDLLTELSAGQIYIRDAHVTLIITARFYRNFWKYRESAKTYAVILMDAAHIGQSLSLISTDLGLAGFYSGAIDGDKVEEHLSLDPMKEGALAIFACGLSTEKLSPFDLRRTPFNALSQSSEP